MYTLQLKYVCVFLNVLKHGQYINVNVCNLVKSEI